MSTHELAAGAELYRGCVAGWGHGGEGGMDSRQQARECSALLLSPARLLLGESCQGEWSGHLISPYKFN